MSLLALMYTAFTLKKNSDNQNYLRERRLLSKWRMEIRSTVQPPVSDHSKFEDLVLAYGR